MLDYSQLTLYSLFSARMLFALFLCFYFQVDPFPLKNLLVFRTDGGSFLLERY
jgi:hypothetical protein